MGDRKENKKKGLSDPVEALLKQLHETEKELESVDMEIGIIYKKTSDYQDKIDRIPFNKSTLLKSYSDSIFNSIAEEPYIEILGEESTDVIIQDLVSRLLDFAEVKLQKKRLEEAQDFIYLSERLGIKDKNLQKRLEKIKGEIIKENLKEGGEALDIVSEGAVVDEIIDLKKRAESKLKAIKRFLKSEDEVEGEIKEKVRQAEKALNEGRYFRSMRIGDEALSGFKKKIEYSLEMRTHTLLDRVQNYLDLLESCPDIIDNKTLKEFKERMAATTKLFLTQDLSQAYNVGQRLLAEMKSLYINKKTQLITERLIEITKDLELLKRYKELEAKTRDIQDAIQIIKKELSRGTREGVDSAERYLNGILETVDREKEKAKMIEKTQKLIRKITLRLVGIEDDERSKYNKYIENIKMEIKNGREDLALEMSEKVYENLSEYMKNKIKTIIEVPYNEIMNIIGVFESLFPEEKKKYSKIKEELVLLHSEGKQDMLKEKIDIIKADLLEKLPYKVKGKLNDILQKTIELRVGLWDLLNAGSIYNIDLKKEVETLKRIEKNPLDSSFQLANYYKNIKKHLKEIVKEREEMMKLFKEMTLAYFYSLRNLSEKWITKPIMLFSLEIILPRAIDFYKNKEFYLSYILLNRIERIFSIHSEKSYILSEKDKNDIKMLKDLIPIGGVKEKFVNDMLERAERAISEKRTLLFEYLRGTAEIIIKS